jgi:hypothetical protein
MRRRGCAPPARLASFCGLMAHHAHSLAARIPMRDSLALGGVLVAGPQRVPALLSL